MKKTTLFVSFFLILFCPIILADAETKTNININGHSVEFTDITGYPYLDANNRTQVPLRVTMLAAGAALSWDDKNKTAVVEKNGTVIKVPMGVKYIIINGKQVANDTQATNRNGIIYLPISAVLKGFAFTVEWDNATKTVYAVNYGDLVNEDGQLVNEQWKNAKTATDVIDAIKASLDHERFEDQMEELAERKYIEDMQKQTEGTVIYGEWYDEKSLQKEGLKLDTERLFEKTGGINDFSISLTKIDTGEVIFSDIVVNNLSSKTEVVIKGITVRQGAGIELRGSDLYNLGYIKGTVPGGE